MPCNTCDGSGRWETTFEEAPTELVDIGACPDCNGLPQWEVSITYFFYADDADHAIEQFRDATGLEDIDPNVCEIIETIA